jgi:hypothetical protein
MLAEPLYILARNDEDYFRYSEAECGFYSCGAALADPDAHRDNVLALIDALPIDYSALPHLSSSLEPLVTSAARAAATAQNTTTQAIVDALGRASLVWNWRESYTDTAATTPAVQGNAVGGWKDWRVGAIATQSNATNKPTRASNGLDFNGTSDYFEVANRSELDLAFLTSGGGIVTLTNSDNGRILARNSSGDIGVLGDAYFMTGNTIFSIAGCFEVIGTLPVDTDRILSGFWNGSVGKSWQNGTKVTYSSPINGTAAPEGNFDPTNTVSNNNEPLFIGRRSAASAQYLDGLIRSIIFFTQESDRPLLEAFVDEFQ